MGSSSRREPFEQVTGLSSLLEARREYQEKGCSVYTPFLTVFPSILVPLWEAGYRAAFAFLRALQELCSHCQAETFQRFFSRKFCLGGDLLNLSVGAVVCPPLDPFFIGGEIKRL